MNYLPEVFYQRRLKKLINLTKGNPKVYLGELLIFVEKNIPQQLSKKTVHDLLKIFEFSSTTPVVGYYYLPKTWFIDLLLTGLSISEKLLKTLGINIPVYDLTYTREKFECIDGYRPILEPRFIAPIDSGWLRGDECFRVNFSALSDAIVEIELSNGDIEFVPLVEFDNFKRII
jgi:hypothetical protein